MKTTLINKLSLGLTGLGLATLSANAAVVASWDGGTGNFADANWTVDGTPSQNHAAFSTDVFTTTINGGIVNNFTNAVTGNIGGSVGNLDSLTIAGGATVNADFIVIEKTTGNDFSNTITLDNGSITVSDANGFRSANIAFFGFINFTGAAGSATVVQTNNTGTAGQELAGKISASSGAASYFSLDGNMVSSGVTYDGSNLTAVNAGLASEVYGGRYFQIEESGGTQTLTLVAVPEPSAALLGGLGLLCMLRRRR